MEFQSAVPQRQHVFQHVHLSVVLVALVNERISRRHALQLGTFVLFGAFWDGAALRALVLDLCGADLGFAFI